MPITFSVDPITQFIYTTATGDIGQGDFTEHAQTLAQTKLFDHPQLIDTRGANLELSTDDIRHLAFMMKSYRKDYHPTKVAMVTDRDYAYGMMRMYMALAADDDPDFCVFRTIEEAEQWIRH
jgi:hypothetical protein